MEFIASLPKTPTLPTVYREMHGLKLFKCEPYAATLSTNACVARYVEAPLLPSMHSYGASNFRWLARYAFSGAEDAVVQDRNFETAKVFRDGRQMPKMKTVQTQAGESLPPPRWIRLVATVASPSCAMSPGVAPEFIEI